MPGKVVRSLIVSLTRAIPEFDEIKVEKVCIGLAYTGVKLNTGHVGVCYTLVDGIMPFCRQVNELAGTLANTSVAKMVELANSWDMSKSVVGTATINALSQIALERYAERYAISERNLIEEVDIRGNDVVALVGKIEPLIPMLKEKAKELYVFERNPALRGEDTLPDLACEEYLPKADVAIITGTAIANGTIDRLLELSMNAREICLVGPSTPIYLDPLAEYGVTMVGGIRVLDPDKLMQVIAEGGGTRQLKTVTRYITVRRLT